jgi:hypothetical protein
VERPKVRLVEVANQEQRRGEPDRGGDHDRDMDARFDARQGHAADRDPKGALDPGAGGAPCGPSAGGEAGVGVAGSAGEVRAEPAAGAELGARPPAVRAPRGWSCIRPGSSTSSSRRLRSPPSASRDAGTRRPCRLQRPSGWRSPQALRARGNARAMPCCEAVAGDASIRAVRGNRALRRWWARRSTRPRSVHWRGMEAAAPLRRDRRSRTPLACGSPGRTAPGANDGRTAPGAGSLSATARAGPPARCRAC